MTAKRKKDVLAAPPPVLEVSGADLIALTGAYKAGLILAWKLDGPRGYCLSRLGRADEYVDVDKLSSFLDKAQRSSLT